MVNDILQLMNPNPEAKLAVRQELAPGVYAGHRRALAFDNAFGRFWRFTHITKKMPSWRLPFLLWLLTAGTLAHGQSLTIGYTNRSITQLQDLQLALCI
jgi:hypothetical protein